MNSVLGCGEAYRIEKIEKIPSRPAAWTVRGTATHEAIQKWEDSGRTIDALEYLQETAWPSAFQKTVDRYPDLDQWLKTPMVKTTEKDLEYRLRDSKEQLQTYITRALAEASDWRIVASEVEFKLSFDDFILVGYIDQIREWIKDGDSRLFICDIKTGSPDSETPLQLGLYGFAAREHGFNVSEGLYWYTKLDRGSDWYVDLDKIYTSEYLQQSYSTLNSIITQRLLLPNPSPKRCDLFCGVREHSILFKESRP